MSSPTLNLIQLIKTQFTSSEEIVFYGGSFNPWHKGHSQCLRSITEAGHEKVIVILDHNPQKKVQTSVTENYIEHQLKGHFPKAFYFADFYHAQVPNPTSQWISELKKELLNPLSLLMGFDSLAGVTEWIEAEVLLKNLSAIYYLSREENKLQKSSALGKIRKINPQLNITHLGHHKFEHLSSKNLRA